MPACLPLLRSVLPNTLSLGLSQLEQQVSEESPPRTLPVGGWNQPAILTSCSGTSISSVGSAKWWFLTTTSFSRYKFLCWWQSPGAVLLWLTPEVLEHEEPFTLVWFFPGSCLLTALGLSQLEQQEISRPPRPFSSSKSLLSPSFFFQQLPTSLNGSSLEGKNI